MRGSTTGLPLIGRLWDDATVLLEEAAGRLTRSIVTRLRLAPAREVADLRRRLRAIEQRLDTLTMTRGAAASEAVDS
jgi:hypothetical protein